MVEGPTDTTTVGLSLQLRHLSCPPPTPFSVFLLILAFPLPQRDNSSCSWVLSSVFSSVNLFLYFPLSFFTALLYQTTLSTSLQFSLFLSPPLTLSIPACLCSKCTYCPRFPLRFPLHGLRSGLQQCHTRICSHKGRRQRLVLPTTTRQCIVFQYRKKSDFIWR